MRKSGVIAAALALSAAVAVPALAGTKNSGTSAPVACASSSALGADGSVTVTPDTLWPPNHQMVNVTVDYADHSTTAAADDGDGPETTMVMITGVTEQDGSNPATDAESSTINDVKGSGAPTSVQGPDAMLGSTSPGSDGGANATAQVQLRAERSGTDGHGSGRTYAISVTCSDSGPTEISANTGSATVNVFVPHDQGQ